MENKKVVKVQIKGSPQASEYALDVQHFLDTPLGKLGTKTTRNLSKLKHMLNTVADWIPEIDVIQDGKKVVVKADLPGIQPDNVAVSVKGDTLIISGKRHEEKETKKKDYAVSERSYGEFLRRIALPIGAMVKSIDATYKDGVLEITIPTAESAAAKKKTAAEK